MSTARSTTWQATDETAAARRWALAATAALALALLAAYYPTVASMVSIWWRSETFTHGFLILPITLFLIWRKRHELALVPARPEPWTGAAALLAAGFLWYLAVSVGVLVLEQLAVVAMVPALVAAVWGWAVVRALAFPLAYLVFAVPMGEALVPPLMDLTADFVVEALRLTGIPVYREGNYFELPTGRWSVVEGCSGVRYLIASLALGSLYAYLTYRSLWRRAVFIALSALVPIVANWLRAYIIVMIGHLSDMRLATGVDHILYGWVFFGAVMLLLFWIGGRWHEPVPQAGTPSPSPDGNASVSGRRVAAGAAAALAALLAWPLAGPQGEVQATVAPMALPTPEAAPGWRPLAEPPTAWRPRYIGPDAELVAAYEAGGRPVLLYVAYYHRQRQGAELVNSQNVLVPQKDPGWREGGTGPAQVRVAGRSVPVRETVLRGHGAHAGEDWLVWRTDWLGGRYLTNRYWEKLLQAWYRLTAGPQEAAALIVATPYRDSEGARARETLAAFFREMLPRIEASLRAARPAP